jgi:hypothetical protein
MEKNKVNWWIDLILLGLFWIAFFPGATGLDLHEWLGAAAIGLAGVHLVLHWQWILRAADRFFAGASARVRMDFLVDLGVFLGFWMILLTGLLISTWLNLPLYDLAAWTDVHLAVSIFTLLLVVGKLILHWRWVACAVQRYVLAPLAGAAPAAGAPRTASPVTRRDFLKVSGVLGAAAALTVHSLVHDAVEAEAQSSLESDASPSPTAFAPAPESASATGEPAEPAAVPTAQPTAVPQELPTADCTVLCPNGCSYPGRCRRYVDRNGNGKCDNGECL